MKNNEKKSPFYIVQDFLSPKLCEQFVDNLEMYEPDVNKDDKPIMTIRQNEKIEAHIFERFQQLVPEIEKYYGFEYKGMEHINFEWAAEEFEGGKPVCENSNYLRKKWVRTKTRDITGVIFFSDYQETIPFDNEYECYGGKLEFPQHGFGFNPQRGTLVLYPSDPHFINVTTAVLAGDLFRAKLQIAAETPYIYQPDQFPGNYKEWLVQFA
jgi:hypothetical protein